MRPGTNRHTDRHTHRRARDQYTFRVVYDSREMYRASQVVHGQVATLQRAFTDLLNDDAFVACI